MPSIVDLGAARTVVRTGIAGIHFKRQLGLQQDVVAVASENPGMVRAFERTSV